MVHRLKVNRYRKQEFVERAKEVFKCLAKSLEYMKRKGVDEACECRKTIKTVRSVNRGEVIL